MWLTIMPRQNGDKKEGKEYKVNRREIFYFVSLACLGIFILVVAYMWGESRAQSKIMAIDKEAFTQQVEETQNGGSNPATPKNSTAKAQSTSTANTSTDTASANPKAESTTTTTVAAANQSNVQNPPSNSTSPVVVRNSYSIDPGSKVGDIVKLGDIEMIVTKSTARHKVIDITLKGNSADQPPRLVLTDNNRIVYEIPADVDVNVDVTEKTVTSKSPLF